MQAFFDMEFQMLITTTIIESGLDIPNVNTIIIERADRFGLSQLYQLRGRVGRSTRKAFAYLMYPRGTLIPEPAQKRLSVINDHAELGAGFSIAMKDMELRGTGNILGSQQHGEMLTVGFEMYVKLLDEAIRELKGADEILDVEPVLEMSYRGYIPDEFIESERLRIELYKNLAGVRSIGGLVELEEEILDRFGSPPHPLRELLLVVRLRVLCMAVGIKHLKEKPNELQLTFEKSRVDIISLIQKVNQNRKIFSISPRDYNTLHVYRSFSNSTDKYRFLKELFDYDDGSG
jgi:transcription-repair coupling factor (superfamily II helicase)